MIEPIFVDSFAWIAAINKSDNYHEISLRILEELLNKHAKLITTNYVVVETINALRARSKITSHFDAPIHPAWLRCSSVK